MENEINNALQKQLIKEIVKSQKHLNEIKEIKKEIKKLHMNFTFAVREIQSIRKEKPFTYPEIIKLREQIQAHSIGVQNVYEEFKKIENLIDTEPVKQLIEYLKPESINVLRQKALEIKLEIESIPYDLIEKFELFRNSIDDLHKRLF